MAKNKFKPDWNSSPWNTLKDWADECLEDNREITPEIAEALSALTGAQVDFWLERERQYRDEDWLMLRLPKKNERPSERLRKEKPFPGTKKYI